MGKGGGEVLLLLGRQLQGLNVAFQLLGHVVELGGQDADLVGGVHIGPDAVIAPGDLPGGAGQVADGRGEHRSQGDARRQAEDHRRQVHQPEGDQILPTQPVQVGNIVAAFQVIGGLIHGKAAGDHHLIYVLGPLRGIDDLIGQVLPGGQRVDEPQAVVPERGDLEGLLQRLLRDLGGYAGAPLHRHGAQHRAHQLSLLRRGGDLVTQLGIEHRRDDGVAADGHRQGDDQYHGQGDLCGKLHPSPSSR